MKYKIIYGKVPTGYIGMNYYAAKELELPFEYKSNVIVIKKNLNTKHKKLVLAHEKKEVSLMRRGYGYHQAHELSPPINIGSKTFEI